MDTRISQFLKEQTIAVVSVVSNERPHSFSCFYAFDEISDSLLFKSSSGTMHIEAVKKNCFVSGCINSPDISIASLKGIQFAGECTIADTEGEAAKVYYKKHLVAKLKAGELWQIKLTWLKFTNNSLGFGTKLEWTNKGVTT